MLCIYIYVICVYVYIHICREGGCLCIYLFGVLTENRWHTQTGKWRRVCWRDYLQRWQGEGKPGMGDSHFLLTPCSHSGSSLFLHLPSPSYPIPVPLPGIPWSHFFCVSTSSQSWRLWQATQGCCTINLPILGTIVSSTQMNNQFCENRATAISSKEKTTYF